MARSGYFLPVIVVSSMIASEWFRKTAESRLGRLLTLCPRMATSAQLLEIGCSGIKDGNKTEKRSHP